MNIISLVLFGTQTRYWYTLLTSVIGNLELYPDFAIRLHISNDVRSHPASEVLDELSDRLPLQVFEFPDAYADTEPSMWRMRPLWDTNVQRFLCRDVDSVPTTEEIQATRFWFKSDLPVHSIRSFHLHDILLMAGLCGFDNTKLQIVRDQVKDFDHYIALFKQRGCQNPIFTWSCDQKALSMMFDGLRSFVYDCPIGNCGPHHIGLGIATLDKSTLHTEALADLNQDLLRICDEIMAVPWGEFKGFAGRPIGDTRSQLKEMLKLDLPSCAAIRDIFDKKPSIKAFYEP